MPSHLGLSPVTTPRDARGGIADGLDLCLEQRLGIPGKTVVPVIAEVLCSAGITEMTEILDRAAAPSPESDPAALPVDMAYRVDHGTLPSGSGVPVLVLDRPCHGWISVPSAGPGSWTGLWENRLFGIPRTDFYIECSHCGAKFIPVGPAFRLVSIATIRDPLWKKPPR